MSLPGTYSSRMRSPGWDYQEQLQKTEPERHVWKPSPLGKLLLKPFL